MAGWKGGDIGRGSRLQVVVLKLRLQAGFVVVVICVRLASLVTAVVGLLCLQQYVVAVVVVATKR